jgi:hypothetical protein
MVKKIILLFTLFILIDAMLLSCRSAKDCKANYKSIVAKIISSSNIRQGPYQNNIITAAYYDSVSLNGFIMLQEYDCVKNRPSGLLLQSAIATSLPRNVLHIQDSIKSINIHTLMYYNASYVAGANCNALFDFKLIFDDSLYINNGNLNDLVTQLNKNINLPTSNKYIQFNAKPMQAPSLTNTLVQFETSIELGNGIIIKDTTEACNVVL